MKRLLRVVLAAFPLMLLVLACIKIARLQIELADERECVVQVHYGY